MQILLPQPREKDLHFFVTSVFDLLLAAENRRKTFAQKQRTGN